MNVPFSRADRFYIDGQWVAPSSPAQFTVLNCATESLFVHVAEAQDADLNCAIAVARRAFDAGPWPRLTPQERGRYLRAIARGLEARAEDLARVWATESGVTYAAARASAAPLIGLYQHYAELGERFTFEGLQETSAGTGLLVREPVGVVAAIIPWNGPGLLMALKCAPALLAGCTVIVKASPEAPGAAYIFAEVCEQIGLPPGVINVLTADRAVSERLVCHPDVDKVTFTGSTAAGRRIAALCGARIARVTLELGGKSPALILDDYDVAAAAGAIATGARFMTGQVCGSLTRIIVSRARHDALLDALAAAFGGTRVGDPFDPETQMGPLATARQRERVEGYIAKGTAEGATLATGGGRPKHCDRGFFVAPTVFGHVDNRMTIAQEEIFGPVLAVIAAEDEADAVRIANDTIFGLNAAVFTHDPERAYAIARQLRAGSVGQNGLRADLTLARGGFKQSGLGREGGVEGLLPFLESKTVVLAASPAHLDRRG